MWEKRQILRMCLEIDMKNLGVRRSLRSLHEFSFAHQVVRILLRKKQENSRRRATPGSAIAPLLRNGYAALRIRTH